MTGTIIILNGPSSSGKSTLSRNLQKLWPKPLYYTSYDLVEEEMSPYPYSRHTYENHPDPVKDFLDVMYTTAAAMALEVFCHANAVPGRLIPVPREISAGCGMCWSAPPEARTAVEQAVNDTGITAQGLYELVI